MGLDMYLTAEKYLSEFDPESKDKIEKINTLFGIAGGDDYRVSSIIFDVAYWRKANAIHGWFVQNIQGGTDDCQKSYVTKEDLTALLIACKEVLSDPKKAETLLPPARGFFFGSDCIDDRYFADIKSTITQIERILNDKALEGMDLCYRSSW